MLKAAKLDGDRGFDLTNAAGYWVGWVKRDGGETLQLMSTGAPLTDGERASLAARASAVIGETVRS